MHKWVLWGGGRKFPSAASQAYPSRGEKGRRRLAFLVCMGLMTRHRTMAGGISFSRPGCTLTFQRQLLQEVSWLILDRLAFTMLKICSNNCSSALSTCSPSFPPLVQALVSYLFIFGSAWLGCVLGALSHFDLVRSYSLGAKRNIHFLHLCIRFSFVGYFGLISFLKF